AHVDAGILVEAGILNCDRGLAQRWWYLAQRYRALAAAQRVGLLIQELPMPIENARAAERRPRPQVFGCRQRRGGPEVAEKQRANAREQPAAAHQPPQRAAKTRSASCGSGRRHAILQIHWLTVVRTLGQTSRLRPHHCRRSKLASVKYYTLPWEIHRADGPM